MLLSSFLLHFSSPPLVIILKLSDIPVHLRYDAVLLVDHVDQILHLPVLGPDHVLQLANPLIPQPNLLVDLSHLRLQLVYDLPLIVQHASLLRDLPVPKVHVRLYPCNLLLRTYNRLIAPRYIPDIVQQIIEQRDLLVDGALILAHLLLDLRLHLRKGLAVDAHDTGLGDLRLEFLLDLGQLDRLAVLVEELGDKAVREVLQGRLVRFQMLVLDRLTHKGELALPPG